MTATHTHARVTMDQCIENCTRCHRICLELAADHFRGGLAQGDERHIRLLLDCAQICATCADFMCRGSELHPITCGACAEICARCAEACERMRDDPRMAACAEACRACERSCREMSRAA
jgi:hypothetical protein